MILTKISRTCGGKQTPFLVKPYIMKKVFILFSIISICITFSAQSQSEFSDNTIHVGVIVTDLEASVDFYTNVIGMKNTGGFSVGADFAKTSGLSNGVPFDVTVLRLEDSQDATQWKLMSFGKKSQHPQQKFIQDDVGMQYITIFVKELRPFVERIKKYNVPFLGETPVVLNETDHFVFVQDPDGNFIELIGPMDAD